MHQPYPDFLRGITPHYLGVVPSLRATGKGPPTLLKTATLFRVRPTVRCAPRHGAHTTLVSNWFAIICTATIFPRALIPRLATMQGWTAGLQELILLLRIHWPTQLWNGLRLPASNWDQNRRSYKPDSSFRPTYFQSLILSAAADSKTSTKNPVMCTVLCFIWRIIIVRLDNW